MGVPLWTKALQAGGLEHLIELDECKEQGNGVEVDVTKALKLYKKRLSPRIIFRGARTCSHIIGRA